MKRASLSLCCVLLLVSPLFPGPALGAPGRDYTVEDLLSVKRISGLEVSPDGRNIAFSVTTPDLDKNSLTSHIWICPVEEGPARQLTNHSKGESSPRWSPDSKHLAFVSSRGGSRQLWRIPLEGGEATQVTTISTGAGSPEWSPTGKHLAFLSNIWPGLEGGDEAQKKRAKERKDSGIQARTIDHLLYRHWDSWRDDKRTHLFVVPAEGGEAVDFTPGDSDVLGGAGGYAFSPDGTEVAFTRGAVNPETGSSADIEAWSINADIWIVPAEGGEATCVTSENKGWDGSPEWSPDGRFLAYRSQDRDGYESDRFRLALLERATGERNRHLPADLDRSVREIVWAPDSKRIYFGAEHEGGAAVFAVSLSGLAQDGKTWWVAGSPLERTFSKISLPRSGRFLAGAVQSLTRPVEVAVVQARSRDTEYSPTRLLTGLNDGLFEKLDMPSAESVRYPGARGKRIQAWLLKPPGHDPSRRYPFVLFIHGGPQGAWSDTFHYRWNLALFAARGFVVLAPNPHGSTGFGQELTEQISGDWAGACYEDLLKATDWAVSRDLADPDRLAAMGGSFGGYMVNWILGHDHRFQCLISHAGVYNLDSMYGATEELWFPEWDLRGTAWKNDGCYEKFSPHRFAANFKTPTLVIHGQLDFRVPVTEGMQLFTALKRQGVDARFLYYPDEGHFVQKPKNSKLWNDTAMEWLEKYAGE